METQGILVSDNVNNLNSSYPSRLKYFSESGNCREEESAFSVIIGFINLLGGKATQVRQVAAGAFILMLGFRCTIT